MPEDQPLSQSDIDAALADSGAADSSEPQANAPDASSQGDEQAQGSPPSADAVPEDAPAEAQAAEPVADSSESTDAGGDFDQSGIDALLADAESLAGEVAEKAPAEAQPEDVQLDSAGRPFDAAAAEMAAAIAEEKQTAPAPEPAPPPAGSEPMALPEFDPSVPAGEGLHPIDLLKNVGLQVKIELGRSRMLVEDVLRLGEGSVVELDKLAGDPVDVYVNDRLVARGEVLVLNDNFCVRVNEIVQDLSKGFQTA